MSFTAPATGKVQLTVELRGGESIVFDKLPIGSTYRITEAGNVYKASYAVVNAAEVGNVVSESGANTANMTDLATGLEIVDEDEEITVTFTNTGVTYSVRFAKQDETGEFLEGATLRITDTLGRTVYEWETDGDVAAYELPAGTFYLSETAAPAGYYRYEGEIEFTVSTNGTITSGGNTVYIISITDYETEVSIIKKEESGNALEGAQLLVIDKEEDVTVYSFTSGTRAETVKGKLEAGKTYILREITAPAGYKLAEDVEFTVANSGVTEVEMTDAQTVARITKVKEDGTPLAGAALRVLDPDGNPVCEFESGEEASIFTGVLSLGVTYTLHEVSAPDGYAIAPDQTFTLDENGEATVTMTDKKTEVSIIKTNTSGEPLEGATLQLLSGETVIEEWVSTTEPHVFTGITVGEYTLHEVEPPEGFILAADITFVLTPEGKITVNGEKVERIAMVDEKIAPPPPPPTEPEPEPVLYNLVVTEEIYGEAPRTDEFTFVLEFSHPDVELPESFEVEGSRFPNGGRIVFSEVTNETADIAGTGSGTPAMKAEFILGHLEEIKIKGLPDGTVIKIVQVGGDERYETKIDGTLDPTRTADRSVEHADVRVDYANGYYSAPEPEPEPEPEQPETTPEPTPEPVPEPDEEIEEPETPLDNIPDTGDSRTTALWFALSALSLFGIATILRKKKEN